MERFRLQNIIFLIFFSQISMNAPVLVEVDSYMTDPLEIAMKELRQKVIPFIIRRWLPDGSYEDWRIDELIID